MISLTVSLPEGYNLVSIHQFWNEDWIVCVKRGERRDYSGVPYGRGQHPDIAEAARLAVLYCDHPELKPEAPRTTYRQPSLASALGLDDIKL